MQKNITKKTCPIEILHKISFGIILILLLAPFVSLALPPEWVDDGGLGTGTGEPSSGGNTGSGSGSGSGTSGTSPSISLKSDLFVQTDSETNVTYTTTRLHGIGGYNSFDPATASTLPLITAYFRYSKATNNHPPIFCNDIYGTNMISTKDIKIKGTDLDKTGKATFYQNISGLTADTIYYYCAIVSNKNNIAYGGSEIVKKFHTNPYGTSVKTRGATKIKSNSVTLNGSYSSIEAVKTYFEYKEASINGTSTTWKTAGEKDYSIAGAANIYGNISANLTKLSSSTRYQFRAVATTKQGVESKIVYGSTLSFITSPVDSAGDNGDGGGVSTSKNKCSNGATNYPNCNNKNNPNCPPGSSCSTNTCQNGTTNYPTCTTICIPGAACTCLNGNTNPPSCTTKTGNPTGPTSCSNGATNPPTCDNTGNPNNPNCTPGSICQNYPIPPCPPGASCDSGPSDGTWTGGTWTGGTWTGGTWVNGVWTSGTWTGGTWTNGVWTGGTWTNNGGTGTGGNLNDGTWGSTDGGISGTWGTGTDSGTWRATTGTGGTGIVYWAGNGDGTGTWYSTTGNGTWTNGRRTGSAGTGTWTSLVLGQTATPPNDAIVRYHEGIETVFIRQIMNRPIFTQKYGYQEGMNLQIFAEDLADQFARAFGYVNTNGKEIRVGPPDRAAYQLQLVGNKLTVYEYFDNKIIDVRTTTATFKNKSDYEYYFKKN